MISANLTVSEMFSIGGMTALIGIGVTFVTLILLIVVILLMEKVQFFAFNKKEKKPIENEKNEEGMDDYDVKDNDNECIVAAITAAISIIMATETNRSKANFVVKSIKRI